jgi:hypothetical protein
MPETRDSNGADAVLTSAPTAEIIHKNPIPSNKKLILVG